MIVVAWSGTPPELGGQRWRLSRYDLQFYGLAARFEGLAEMYEEEELVERYPIVQIESRPGQPTLIDEERPSFAVAGSLATVKALVLAGFGVGALLSFVFTPAERARVLRAKIPHDPDCSLWLITHQAYLEQGAGAQIATSIAEALTEAEIH